MITIGRHVSKLSGYAPALPTPFDDDGNIDVAAFDRFCAELKTDVALRRRALKWLDRYPPIGVFQRGDSEAQTSFAKSFT